MRYLLPLLLLASSLCLAFGLVLPLVRMDRLYFFSQSPSLVEIVSGLWLDSEIALALLVGLFSIAFPIAKLAVLHILAFGRATGEATRAPHWLKTLGRLSMVDVLLVALVIFAAKTSGLATALTQPGLWFFTASAVLSTVALNRLK
jgi:paraquat-inducible protein A